MTNPVDRRRAPSDTVVVPSDAHPISQSPTEETGSTDQQTVEIPKPFGSRTPAAVRLHTTWPAMPGVELSPAQDALVDEIAAIVLANNVRDDYSVEDIEGIRNLVASVSNADGNVNLVFMSRMLHEWKRSMAIEDKNQLTIFLERKLAGTFLLNQLAKNPGSWPQTMIDQLDILYIQFAAALDQSVTHYYRSFGLLPKSLPDFLTRLGLYESFLRDPFALVLQGIQECYRSLSDSLPQTKPLSHLLYLFDKAHEKLIDDIATGPDLPESRPLDQPALLLLALDRCLNGMEYELDQLVKIYYDFFILHMEPGRVSNDHVPFINFSHLIEALDFVHYRDEKLQDKPGLMLRLLSERLSHWCHPLRFLLSNLNDEVDEVRSVAQSRAKAIPEIGEDEWARLTLRTFELEVDLPGAGLSMLDAYRTTLVHFNPAGFVLPSAFMVH